MARASNRVLWALLVVGLVLGAFGALRHRLRMEATSRTVELAVDYDSYSEYFHAQGVDEDEGFRQLKDRGVTAVAFNESYLTTMQQAGRVKLYSGNDLMRVQKIEDVPSDSKPRPDRVYLLVYDDATFGDLQTYLGIFLGKDKVAEWGRPAGSVKATPVTPRVLEVVGSERLLTGMGLGFESGLVDHLHRMGFNTVLRPENKTNGAPQMIAQYFKAMPAADCVIFGGPRNEALGYPITECMDADLQEMRARHMLLGMVEVATPKNALKGQQYLTQRYPEGTVRAQSIPPAQQSKLSMDDALDMFRLGARERNVRLIYLRPFTDPNPGSTLVDTNNDYVKGVADMLRNSRFQAGQSSTFDDVSVPAWASVALNVAVGAAVALLWLAFFPDSGLAWLPVVLFAVASVGFAAIHKAETWAKVAALVGALCVPTLAMLLVWDRWQAPEGAARGPALGTAVLQLVGASLVSLAGGLLVASILAYTPFMLEIDQFRGIKLLMVVPPLLALLYAVRQQGSLRTLVRDLWQTPLTFGMAVVMLVVLAGGVFYIMRTGNTPETGASDTERMVRNMLQTIFIARPRFKDFCIGHPAFIVGGFLSALGAMRTRRPLMLLLLVLATIGQSDIVDTFAHVHTPYLISLLRAFNGIWLGTLVGLVVSAFVREPARVPEATEPAMQAAS